MKYIIVLLAIVTVACKDTDKIPSSWDKDLIIELYDGGGMQNKSLTITYTYDSGKYVSKENNIVTVKLFALSAEDRDNILKRLRSMGLEKIKTEKQSLTYDKGTTSLCITQSGTQEFCISDSATTSIVEDPDKAFAKAWKFLEDLVLERGN